MLPPTAKAKRFLEATQFVLTFVSVCAIVEGTRIHSPPHDRPGYYASFEQFGAAGDRRLADLARSDRKRREAEQAASRRGLEREQVGLAARSGPA